MLDIFAEGSSFKKTDFQIAFVLFPIEAERLGRRGSQEILIKLASRFSLFGLEYTYILLP